MARPDNWRVLPVWICHEDLCGEYWVDTQHLSEKRPPFCPERSCHESRTRDLAQYAGFTWGEASEAGNKFGCDIPIHYAHPIPPVVQLSTLPQHVWVGLPVFHPCSQSGVDGEIKCNWHSYDVGVVIEVYPDPDFADYGELQVRFQGALADGGWTLHYSPSNLWVPFSLAQLLG